MRGCTRSSTTASRSSRASTGGRVRLYKPTPPAAMLAALIGMNKIGFTLAESLVSLSRNPQIAGEINRRASLNPLAIANTPDHKKFLAGR